MELKQTYLNIYAELLRLFKQNTDAVVATVTNTNGPTPQVAGSTALFTGQGLAAGTIGGGAVELSVLKKSAAAISRKVSSYEQFNLNNHITDNNGPVCGGVMRVLLDAEPQKHIHLFEALTSAYHHRLPGLLITLVSGKESDCVDISRTWVTGSADLNAFSGCDWVTDAEEMLRKPRYGACREIPLSPRGDEKIHFVVLQSILPCPKLLIAGAGHVGKALSHLGKLLEFEVTVWDNRSDYATPENLPDADHILSGSLEESLSGYIPDKDTYIVIVTPGHKYDTEVLKVFIGSEAGYVGMIGSKRKISLMRQNFLNTGWATPEQLERLHAPIGLKINSVTVQEIAVSIAAQLIIERNRINQGNG